MKALIIWGLLYIIAVVYGINASLDRSYIRYFAVMSAWVFALLVILSIKDLLKGEKK